MCRKPWSSAVTNDLYNFCRHVWVESSLHTWRPCQEVNLGIHAWRMYGEAYVCVCVCTDRKNRSINGTERIWLPKWGIELPARAGRPTEQNENLLSAVSNDSSSSSEILEIIVTPPLMVFNNKNTKWKNYM